MSISLSICITRNLRWNLLVDFRINTCIINNKILAFTERHQWKFYFHSCSLNFIFMNCHWNCYITYCLTTGHTTGNNTGHNTDHTTGHSTGHTIDHTTGDTTGHTVYITTGHTVYITKLHLLKQIKYFQGLHLIIVLCNSCKFVWFAN